MAEHLASAARQRGKVPKVAPTPALPAAAAHVWDWFAELAGQRTMGPMAPNPLTWGDVAAWAALTRRTVRPWEARLVMALDRCWVQSVAPPKEPKGLPARG